MKADKNFARKSLDLISERIRSRAENSHNNSGYALGERAESGRVCKEGLRKGF